MSAGCRPSSPCGHCSFCEPEGAVLPAPKDPMAVAGALIADAFQSGSGALLLRHWRGSFWRWHRTHWAEIEENAIRSIVYTFTENACFLDNKGTPTPWSPNRYKVADTLDALRAIGHLPEKVTTPSWIRPKRGPKASDVVAVKNGLLVISTRDLIEHDPDLFNEVSVPFPYDPSAPQPSRWTSFLDQLWPDDPDSIAALQEYFGYVISGRTDLQKILLIVGPTRAGKGVIARVLKALVGDAAGPTLASLGTNFGLAPLIGKPLAIVSDARLGRGNAEAIVERLLSISGEDMLTIDRKYREPWTGTLPSRFVVISNELPRFGDASGAIANRFVILSLKQSFLGNENPRLTRDLLDELPGILNWALDGLQRLADNGTFTTPTGSLDAITRLQDLASPVAAFIRERCETTGEVSKALLFAAWKEWAEDNGHKAGSSNVFGRNLFAVVPGITTTQPRTQDGRDRHYVGIRLRAHNAPERVPTRANGTNPDPEQVGTGSNALLAHVAKAPEHDAEVVSLFASEPPDDLDLEEVAP